MNESAPQHDSREAWIGMTTGGWLAGALFDAFGFYLPAFVVGLMFNLLNFAIVLWLVARERNDRPTPIAAHVASAA